MTYENFSADNAALLLIDHQVGTWAGPNRWLSKNSNATP